MCRHNFVVYVLPYKFLSGYFINFIRDATRATRICFIIECTDDSDVSVPMYVQNYLNLFQNLTT